ncbi:MAG: SapC family protein [Gammaproteobacteria bacterium]
MSNSVKFLQTFHKHTIITRDFCKALDAADILEPMQTNVALNSGAKFSLPGLLCATREKLKALSAGTLETLFAADYLELIYLHMHSLNNLDELLQSAQARQAVRQ